MESGADPIPSRLDERLLLVGRYPMALLLWTLSALIGVVVVAVPDSESPRLPVDIASDDPASISVSLKHCTLLG